MEPQTASLIAMIVMGILGLLAGWSFGFYHGYAQCDEDGKDHSQVPDYLSLRLSRDTRAPMPADMGQVE